MKFLYTFLLLFFISSIHVFAQSSDDVVAFRSEPLTDEELSVFKTENYWKKFIQLISSEEEQANAVHYFTVYADNGEAFDRMIIQLYQDPLVLKLQPNQDKIAILTQKSFDINRLVKAALNSGINLTTISKEVFSQQIDNSKP
ncbi:MAG: hypothetical protein M9958_09695 [Chitinophagales bacterium]|nr:hypothetical protein [Chitinophagales bacterium]